MKFYNDPLNMERFEQLSEAFYKVARANHYMVGVTETFTDDELIGAYGRLIDIDNSRSTEHTRLALTLIEHEKLVRRLS